MIDYKKAHRCLLADLTSGESQYGYRSPTVQALILAGFIQCKKTMLPDGQLSVSLSLTPAGHRYLEGLWH